MRQFGEQEDGKDEKGIEREEADEGEIEREEAGEGERQQYTISTSATSILTRLQDPRNILYVVKW